MKNLFYRLIIYIDTANENDLNYKIALYMANNFYRIDSMRISELAKECFVSAATISRFCRELGYENYAHLKQECSSFKSLSTKFNNLIDVDPDLMSHHPLQASVAYVNQVAEALKALPQTLNWYVIDEVLRLIHDSEKVVMFGTHFSNSAAVNFQTDLLMLEKFTYAYMDTEKQLACAMTMSREDVAIIVSLNGMFLQDQGHKLTTYLKRTHSKMILITSLADDQITEDFDYVIHIGMPTSGKTTKHVLLTAMELMSLRYYTLYYPCLEELKGYLK
ncbi:MAG: MurR/RpiR family transcriptional regulator [bacterium]